MIFGDYFAYDTGYAIKSDFRAEYPNLSKNEFNYLFDTFNSVYDIPNIFLPLINGVLAVRVRPIFSFCSLPLLMVSLKIIYTLYHLTFLLYLL